MAETDDTPTIHLLQLSMLASEVLLAIMEEYQAVIGAKSESIVINKYELLDMFDHVIAKSALDNMEEYGTQTNLKGLVNAVKEIDREIAGLNDKDIIEIDFGRILENM